jgi:hypothetical protein
VLFSQNELLWKMAEFGLSFMRDYLWLFLETRSDPNLDGAQFSELHDYTFSPPILLLVKAFDAEEQELGKH